MKLQSPYSSGKFSINSPLLCFQTFATPVSKKTTKQTKSTSFNYTISSVNKNRTAEENKG